jgi:HD-GYP domain-containing protein (c-di-GMP phosphodiesterase class II)
MDKFNFEGAKKFDKANGYRSKSMLVIPMLNQDEETVGVMQLINKRSGKDTVTFTNDDIAMTTTYANLSASAIAKNQLIEDLEKLVISFLKSIAYALSVKSPYGYGHITRVKDLMGNILKEINDDDTIYSDKNYTKEQLQELELAAWMHDIGKISTPEYIIDKATRLETVFDRVEMIKMRFNYVRYFLISQNQNKRYDITIKQLEEDLEFIIHSNKPSTFMDKEAIKRVAKIANLSFEIEGKTIHLLSQDEKENLSIVRGTLNDDERNKINEHAQTTYEMLQMITFPKKYSRVTEIASAHHEKLNGKGYPRGLKAQEISFEARMLAIVDILEALTANDRPYKKAKTEEETFQILDNMVKNNELDEKLVSFIKKVDIFGKYIKKEELEEVC